MFQGRLPPAATSSFAPRGAQQPGAAVSEWGHPYPPLLLQFAHPLTESGQLSYNAAAHSSLALISRGSKGLYLDPGNGRKRIVEHFS